MLAQQLSEAWAKHQRSLIFLIDQLPEEAYRQSLSKRGGRTVLDQFVHLHSIRNQYLEDFARKQALELSKLPKKPLPTLPQVKEALEQSANLIKKYLQYGIEEKQGKLPGFKAGVLDFYTYLISHEAHHKGNILLTVKQSGIKIPENLKWGLWDWKKL